MIRKLFEYSFVAITAVLLASTMFVNAAGRGRKWQPRDSSGGSFACAAQDLSGGPTCEAIESGEADYLVVKIALTQDSATDVTMTCEISADDSDWYPHPGCSNATSPTIDCDDGTWQKDGISADDDITFIVPLYDEYTRCSFAGTSATSSDLITVKYTVGANN